MPATADAAVPVVELGLTSPLEKLEDIESFSRDLAERLVWAVHETGREGATASFELRFTAVRLDRGRVTASYQSDVHKASGGFVGIAEFLGLETFSAFPDVCFRSEDPPAAVRALSGRTRLDAEGLERAIAEAAQTREIDRLFGLGGPLNIEWGRHVVLILAASSEGSPILVQPLILLLERT
ncbi:MAG: hypothetical protein ACODAA_00285 [Gemmatimonadota bacterium]